MTDDSCLKISELESRSSKYVRNDFRVVIMCFLNAFHYYGNTSNDATGHNVSDVPGIIGCLGFFNIIHPHPGDPAGADQTPACVQMAC